MSCPLAWTGADRVEPATRARFDDVATVLGPENPAANVCWCLSHRLDSRTNRALVGPARGEYVRTLTGRPIAPRVLTYDGGEVVGWAAVARLFEKAGFTKVADTGAVSGGFPRVLVRRTLA